MKKLFFPLLALSLLLAACAGEPAAAAAPDPAPGEAAPQAVVAEGRLEPVPSAELAFGQPGVVQDVLAEAGQELAAGQAIARTREYAAAQAGVARAQADYLSAAQAYERAEAEALAALARTNEDLRRAQYDLDNFDLPSGLRGMTSAEALEHTYEQLQDARAAFEPYRYLEERLEKELAREDPANPRVYRDSARNAKRRLDDAWAEYDRAIRWAALQAGVQQALARRDQAALELERLRAGEDGGSAASAAYASAEAALEAARAALEGCELRAPFAGTLLSLDLQPGEYVAPGAPVAFLAGGGRWQVETVDLAEIDVARVAPGAAVTLELDAFPGETFGGQVAAIDPVGREHLGDMTYRVTVALDEPDARFKWNMTAVVTIEAR